MTATQRNRWGTRLFAGWLAPAALVFATALQAAEIEGEVKEVAGREVTIRVEGTLAPRPGDTAKLTLEHPALGTINVGVWEVTEVKFPTVKAAVKEATGEPEPLMAALIVSANPVDMSAPVEATETVVHPAPAKTAAEKRLIAALRDDPSVDVAPLVEGVNVNTADEEGAFPLALAARGGNVENVRRLLEAGANPNLESPDRGQTALKLAAFRGHNEVVGALLEGGAVIDYRGGEYENRFSRVTALFLAAARGHADTVKLLIERGADPYAENAAGEVALGYAARAGHIDVVNAFAEAGVSVDYVSSTGLTPLIAAADNFEDNWEMFVYLLGAGANVNAQIPKGAKLDADLIGMTPLMLAADSRGDVLVLLRAGADPGLRDAQGRTAADIAAARLREAKANGWPVESDLARQRALTDPEWAREQGRARINEVLSDMVEENNVVLVASLLALGGDPDLVETTHDERILSLAVKEGFGPMAKLLVEHGASPNAPGKDGLTPFHHVFGTRDTDLARYMLAHGADPTHVPPGMPFNLMHAAAMEGFAGIVPDLAKAGLDVDARGLEGNTPLHLAADEGNLEAFRALIEAGADPRIRNDEGERPLDLVSSKKRAAFEKALAGGR